MRYLRRRAGGENGLGDNDPLNGVANLFDLGLVFIVGLLLALFGLYHLEDLLQQDTTLTITKQAADGSMEMIVKEGRKLEAVRVSKEEAKGRGQRLGTAYRLENGSMIYVPEERP